MNNYFEKINFKRTLKKNAFTIILSFFVGVIFSSIPHLGNALEYFNQQKIIQERNLQRVEALEEKCKNDNSTYTKLINLGFPETAMEAFNNCMDINLEINDLH